MKIWFNDEIINYEDARVSVLSPTAQFGLNVFEGIRCYWNEERRQLYAFRLEEHFHRLQDSCKLMRIPCPYNKQQLKQYLIEIIRANEFMGDVAVRMTIYIDGNGSWNSEGPVGMFVAPILKSRTILPINNGKSACVSSWERINDNCMPPRIKAGANYINGRYAHLDAVKSGFDLPLLLDHNGTVAEGAGACLFIVRGGVLISPPISSSILESITRRTIIEFSKDMDLQFVERAISRTELYVADEVFLCGSAAEITPITMIDHYAVGDGAPGVITSKLLEKYIDIVSGKDCQYMNWLTPIYGQS